MRKRTRLFIGFFLLAVTTLAQQNKKSLLYDLVSQKRQTVKTFKLPLLFKEILTPPLAHADNVLSNKVVPLTQNNKILRKETCVEKSVLLSEKSKSES